MNNSTSRMLLIIALLSLALAAPICADEDESQNVSAIVEQPAQTEQQKIEPYVPPVPARPTPNVRVATGGTRGAELKFPTVTLLVPDHVAFTSDPQPIVYWHISERTRQPTVITLSINDEINPLLELKLNSPVEPGIHALKFSDHDITLVKDKIYEWSVSINENPDGPSSGDLIAKAFIQRVAVNDEIAAAKSSGDLIDMVRIFAQGGLWYDALSTTFMPIDDPKMQMEIKDLKASMLRQVGIELNPS